jgi:hypothetical protein
MEIPKGELDRQHFYAELVRNCASTRTNRFNFNQALRNYYLFGSQDAKGAPYNKLGSVIEQLVSFIYAADSTKFSLKLGTMADPEDPYKAVELSRELVEQWRSSKTHLLFGVGIRWSLVYGLMLMKTQWAGRHVRSYLVEPHQFGVLREDIMDLKDQEAFTHHYTTTKSELMASLRDNPRKASIEAQIAKGGSGDVPANFAEGLQRLMVGGPVTGIPGSLALGGGMTSVEGGMAGKGPPYDYAPRVDVELLDMCDLYVWSDEEEDYQLVTQCSPGVVIYDRLASEVGHIRGEPPFSTIRSSYNLYDYFWGDSYLAKLSWLQDWRTKRTLEVSSLLSKQANPPISAIGIGGIQEEKMSTFRAAGGFFSSPTPNGKMEFHPPQLPNDLFVEINAIDGMFEDSAGLGHILQGKGEAGVRSRGQADLMARLGSARPKERAMAIEECAEDIARLILLTTQEHSDQRFQVAIPGRPEPLTFTAEQFTKDYEVKVDGHSASPIFTEDLKHDAVTLFEAHAITREKLLDMFDPPNLQALKEDLKVIEANEAKQKQLEMQMQGAGDARKQ